MLSAIFSFGNCMCFSLAEWRKPLARSGFFRPVARGRMHSDRIATGLQYSALASALITSGAVTASRPKAKPGVVSVLRTPRFRPAPRNGADWYRSGSPARRIHADCRGRNGHTVLADSAAPPPECFWPPQFVQLLCIQRMPVRLGKGSSGQVKGHCAIAHAHDAREMGQGHLHMVQAVRPHRLHPACRPGACPRRRANRFS